MIIDLHSHSTCSDGQYSPLELIKKAINMGINYYAITDHDTFGAFFKLLEQYDELKSLLEQSKDFTYIPGCELSVNSQVDGKKHHLCIYFPQLALSSKHHPKYDSNNETYKKLVDIESSLNSVRENRVIRSKNVFDKLEQHFGLKLDFNEFCQMNKINMETKTSENVVGRPMIANYLMHKGYIKSVQEAFETYISDNSPAHVRLPPVVMEDKIKEIKQAGAIFSLAHPYQWQYKNESLKKQIESAIAVGLDCIEKYHFQQGILNKEQVELFGDKLTYSIASDFHGEAVVPNVELGNLMMNSIMSDEEKQNLLKKLKLL